VLTFKTQQTSSPQYLSQHISLRTSARNTRSSSVPAVRAILTDIICQTIVQHCRTSGLELTATCCVKLRHTLSLSLSLSLSLLSNPDLKLICFLLHSANYSTYLLHQRLCSHITALWRYANFVLLLLLLLLVVVVVVLDIAYGHDM